MLQGFFFGQKYSKCYGILAVTGAFLIHLTLGTLYTAGNMNPYMTSYIREYSYPPTMTYGDGTWLFAAATAGNGFSMCLGGLASRRIGPRWTTLIGGVFMSCGVLLTYLTIKVSYVNTLLTYGVMFGLGSGFAYASPLAVGMMWFPEHQGLVSGIILAGFGGGAGIFNEIQTEFINPDNKIPDTVPYHRTREIYFSNQTASDVLERVPRCFLLLGVSYIILQVIGVLLLFSPPKFDMNDTGSHEGSALLLTSCDDETGDSLYRERPSECQRMCCAEMIARDMTAFKALKTRPFITMWFLFFVNGQSVVFITSLYKAYGQTFIHDDHMLTTLGSVSAIFNALGRIMWGHLADRFSFKAAMLALCTGMIIFMMTLVICPAGGLPMFFVWICVIYLFMSGNYSLLPAAAAKSFGNTNVAITYGCLFTSQVITSPLGAVLVSTLQVHIGWLGMFTLVSGFLLVGWFLTLSFNVKSSSGKNI